MQNATEKATLLVVDDVADNIALLASILRKDY
jgi:CheY-like chemotaxis protein